MMASATPKRRARARRAEKEAAASPPWSWTARGTSTSRTRTGTRSRRSTERVRAHEKFGSPKSRIRKYKNLKSAISTRFSVIWYGFKKGFRKLPVFLMICWKFDCHFGFFNGKT